MSPLIVSTARPQRRGFNIVYAPAPPRAAAALEREWAARGVRVVVEHDGLGGIWALPEGRLPVAVLPIKRAPWCAVLN